MRVAIFTRQGKKTNKNLLITKKVCTFAFAIQKDGSVAQLNRALDYGSRGCGFESRRSHQESFRFFSGAFLFVPFPAKAGSRGSSIGLSLTLGNASFSGEKSSGQSPEPLLMLLHGACNAITRRL